MEPSLLLTAVIALELVAANPALDVGWCRPSMPLLLRSSAFQSAPAPSRRADADGLSWTLPLLIGLGSRFLPSQPMLAGAPAC